MRNSPAKGCFPGGKKKDRNTAVGAEKEEGDDENEDGEKEEEIVEEVVACGCVGLYRTEVEASERVKESAGKGGSKRRIGRAREAAVELPERERE